MSRPQTQPVYTRLSDKDRHAAERAAERAERSLSAWIGDVIRAELAANKPAPKSRRVVSITEHAARVRRVVEKEQ